MLKKLIALLLLCLVVISPVRGSEKIEKMTYEQAKARLPNRSLPDFWFGDVEGLSERWQTLDIGKVKVIAQTPGGRPVHLITYGQKEDANPQANFNSAIGAHKPTAYMDKASRRKPVVYFVGPVHGQEVENLTGLVNFINVMETGRDLRGKEQPKLRALGGKCRVLIVPAGNPDGIARFEPRAAKGLSSEESSFWAMGTWSDHTIAYWPDSKAKHPRTSKNSGYIGSYFNDAGINPMHDEFFAPMSSEAPAILKVAMEEGPDLAVSMHSYSAAPGVLRPAYLPMEVQQQAAEFASFFYKMLDERSLPHAGLFKPLPENGTAPFNLTSAIYHVSGATSMTFECPHGFDSEKTCKVTFEQILDIQLTFCEAMLRFGLQLKQK